MAWSEILFGSLLVVVLVAVAIVLGVRQVRQLRLLRTQTLPDEEMHWERRKAWRRLGSAGLLFVIASLLVAQFGILAPLTPIAFIVTAVKQWRYALLTGTAVAITCFFNASYVNADISRYYVGPALMAWTWLAIMAGAIVDVLVNAGGPEPLAEPEPAERGRATEPELAPEPEPAATGHLVSCLRWRELPVQPNPGNRILA